MSMAQIGRKMYPERKALLSGKTAELIANYDCDRNMILATDKIEICKEKKNEVVIRSDKTGPGGNMLNKQSLTKVAKISISILWVLS